MTFAEYESVIAGNDTVFVKFYSDTCVPCKSIAPLLETAARKLEYAQVKFYEVNVTHDIDQAKAAGIQRVPTFRVIQGKAAQRSHQDFHQAAGLMPALRQTKE